SLCTDSTASVTTKGAIMKATALLEQQHRRVDKLYRRIQRESAPAKRDELFRKLALELAAHLQVEEEIFYPALRSLGGVGSPLVAESAHEQDVLPLPLRRALRARTGGVPSSEQSTRLWQLIVVHFAEEEERLFPLATERLDADWSDALGILNQQRFTE